ncbi:hypothetical protein [Poseidonocella sp. HB161398]|uniref:hypothetical protein n=1 Tax=Poseidonocella sp. HB161398 TaxID=2320855 RepID=UPI00110967AC|nr:hypothetical protein [Poseidonocella sp. HB161398]
MSIPEHELDALAERIANGNAEAGAYLALFMRVARLIDDIADGDSTDVPGDMLKIATALSVDMPQNPFFREHALALSNAHALALAGWTLGDTWRTHPNEKTRMFSFVMREHTHLVLATVARITGGFDHMLHAMTLAHIRNDQTNSETFADFEEETARIRMRGAKARPPMAETKGE